MRSSESIGDVAARFGLATHVLRHWEDVGLLTPDRDAAGRRRYADDDLVRIGVILHSKAAGMSLEQVEALLDEQSPSRHRVLEQHLEDLARRMAEMERSRRMTEHALRCSAHDIATCGRFQELLGDIRTGAATWSDDRLAVVTPDEAPNMKR